MKSKSQKIHFALLVSAVALTNCANPRMMQVPPAPVVEIIPVNNNAGYLWIPGRYRYQRGAYVWHQGGYQHLPRGRSSWVQGKHELVRGRYRYRNGYWQ